MRRFRTIAAVLAAAAGSLTPAVARAHFVLQSPQSWSAQSSLGDPQKSAPCGQTDPETPAGPTGVVTAFEPGQTITVAIDETVYHPGHYRVVLSTTGHGGLPDDPVTNPPNTCAALDIQDPPVYPVLADGVLPHTDPLGGPQSFQVTLPGDVTCAHCTLQVLEFMSAEVGGNGKCFYHHCADISIGAAAKTSGCGCTVGRREAPSGVALLLLAVFALHRRRAR